MRSTRIITAIISFSATFLLSVFIASLFVSAATSVLPVEVSPTVPYKHRCSKSGYAGDITRFIQQDVRNGETRMRKLYRLRNWDDTQFSRSAFAAQAEAIQSYSEASLSMEDNHLPQDFRNAWRKHMKAWSDFSDFLNTTKETWDEEESFKSRDFNVLESRYNAEINSTWYEVLRIGRKYGAETGY